MDTYHFHLKDYQKHKSFSSFLSGVSGPKGIPLWAFYVNRGQLIASFGIHNKNGAIMEFFPANAAYHFVSKIGFRTFIKMNNQVYECFKETDSQQSLDVYPDQVSISQYFEKEKIEIKVTYFTLPNERIAALNRKVEITNHSSQSFDIEIVDGLAQILPTGVDYGGYKAISNLLQSWMETKPLDDYLFFTLRGSTGDSAEVSEIKEGNFMHTMSVEKPTYIYDYKSLFKEDNSLVTPYGLIDDSLLKSNQTKVNQVPCAMVYYQFKNIESNEKKVFVSMFGHAESEEILKTFIKKTSISYALNKEQENKKIHEDITNIVETKTNFPIFDAYLKQCYLDNVLRGGYPIQIKAKDNDATYYIYSRKHGDLERDYNFFNLEPAYYSQGNGNFRDVLQNRRNDIIFFPEIKAFNVLMFSSFIQDDGYNPLSIEGIEFSFDGHSKDYPNSLAEFLKKPYTPGNLLMLLEDLKLNEEETFKNILSQSKIIYKASFHEGYWEDHFTYLYDLIEGYESIYPDQMKPLLFEQDVLIYQSNAYVNPRSEKYVLTKSNQIRQFGALKNLEQMDCWLKKDTHEVSINVIGKLLTLIINKYAHLDPEGIGLSYEANKPGWNDACNGLPGLFGSGISETFELIKLVRFVKQKMDVYPDETVKMLKDTYMFAKDLEALASDNEFNDWDLRMTTLESYRLKRLEKNIDLKLVKLNEFNKLITKINLKLEKAVLKAKTLGSVIPTYLTFEAKSYQPILNNDGSQKIGEYGLPLVNVEAFKMRALPIFLEGPARYLKNLSTREEALKMYHEVKKTGLYDRKHQFYQTSVSLDDESFEIGRLKAFTPGWLERESNFLHMTYKYLLGLLKAGLYDIFYEEIKTNFTCFMDPDIYGRSPIENSSFLATSSNPDIKKHGQGFVSRLSGSTAEALSMYRFMFYGNNIFQIKEKELTFNLNPKLSSSFFKDKKVETKLFGSIDLIYYNPQEINTYDANAYIKKIVLTTKNETKVFESAVIKGKWAEDIRLKNVLKIEVYYNKEEK